MRGLLRLSGCELARRIRDGEVTSRRVCEAHIDRIRAVNPVINAVVADRFEAALREADAADTLVRTGPRQALPPFHGVPCTIKEAFAVQGMPNTAGLVTRQGQLSADDAPTVARVRAAGAIVLGVTNISELCMWMESDNRVYGRSNNPYDPTRIVGGSSGGEGAIVGAGGSPFGLGSDIGGSIRGPAFFNGVFGHKPTGGLVPSTGQYPRAEGSSMRLMTTGPIARRAEDLYPLLRLLAGPDAQDPSCKSMKLGDPAEVDLSTLRVLDIEDNGTTPVSPELRAGQRRIADFLASKGARVRRERIPALVHSFEIWSAVMAEATHTSFAELLGDGRRLNVKRELGRLLVGRSAHTLPALGLAVLEGLAARLPDRTRRMARLGRDLEAQMMDLVGENGVLLYPSYPTTAPRHGHPILRPLRWVYFGILNVLAMPSTQVPLGLGRGGLPLGLQVAAAPGNDHLTLAVAAELERAFGGWVAPPDLRAAT